jgi:multidrug efflux pump subunit AcrA (membrane-fusion protein)
MKRATIVKLALLIAALPLAAGCSRHAEGDEDDAAAPAAVVPVRTAAVEERTFADAVEAPGQWKSSGDVSLASPFMAVVDSLGPRLGDHVTAGDTLGMLVTRESRAVLRGAELLLSEAHDAAARAEAERAAALAKRDLVRVPLVAPRTGVVTKRDAEPGSEVGDGAEVLAITPAENIVFEARLPAAATPLVHVGTTALVRAAGEPDRQVHVTRVLPAASATDQATLVWLKPLAGGTPMLDRFGTAIMTTSGTRRSPAVPEAAVVENDLDGSTRLVVVAADSVAAWTSVKLGATADGWRELVGGTLAPGALVVVEGQRGLPDSTHVKPQQ